MLDLCRKIGRTAQPYDRWKKEYGGLRVDPGKRLKTLEQKNLWLNRIIAVQAVDLSSVNEVAWGSFSSRGAVGEWLCRILQWNDAG